MRKTLLLLICMGYSFFVFTQNLEIKGIVKDASTNEVLIGVTVVVPTTQLGMVTGIDGDFSLFVPQNAMLRFSYVGYKTVNIKVGEETNLEIGLEPISEMIDEIVVVGYQVQKKRDVLGAVSKIDAENVSKLPVANVQQTLQGRVAGMNVASQTGAPGANISVRIRGVNSIGLSNDPLYIVDGVPVEGALNNLSPNEIENMTILKDASSAAIYGSRAANGVVLITTKSGESGDSKISYNMQVGFQQHGHLTKMVNTAEYIDIYNEAARTDNATSVVKRALIEGAYLKDFADVNHVKEIFRTAPFQQHELSMSGGTDKTQYLIAGTIYRQDGIIINSNYDRVNIRSNINSQVKKWLKVNLNVSGGYANRRWAAESGDGYASGQGGSIVRYAFFRNPAIPVYNSNGDFVDLPSEYYGDVVYNSFFGDGYSPEGLAENTDRTSKIKSLLATGNVLITLPANFIFKTTAGIDYSNTETRVFNKTWGTANRINALSGLNINNVDNANWTVNSTLNQNVVWQDKHTLNWLVGVEAIRNAGSGLSGSEADFKNIDSNFLYLGLGNAQTNVSQSVAESTLVSFFANANYHYKHRYYLSAIVRRDGSSRFYGKNKWGNFFSVSSGWNVEEEAFMQDIRDIDKLKLRIGYGAIGNQNIPLYAYTDRYGYNYYYTFGANSMNGFVMTQLGNKDLKWETSNQFNAGVDMEFFKSSFGVTLDYYYKITKDMLLPASLPPSIGNAVPFQINSSGSVLNTGIDIELFYRKQYKDGGFNIAFNGGFLHNEVLNIDAPYFAGRVDSGVNVTRTETGYPIGSFFLYQMDGIFQNDVEILTSAYQGRNIKPGDVKYRDVHEDGVIDAQDRIFSGSTIPDFTTGLNLSGNYKQFDASLFFQGAFGQKIFSQVNFDIEGYYRGFAVTKRYYDEHWTGEGTSNTQPRASWSAKANNVRASTRFLEDGSYFRLKNVQVGYTLPNTKKIGIESLRFFIAGTNLLTLTKYSGLDPEMTVSADAAAQGYSDMANGIDWGTYPVAMTFTFGLNLTL